jgi:hypothetical protein
LRQGQIEKLEILLPAHHNSDELLLHQHLSYRVRVAYFKPICLGGSAGSAGISKVIDRMYKKRQENLCHRNSFCSFDGTSANRLVIRRPFPSQNANKNEMRQKQMIQTNIGLHRQLTERLYYTPKIRRGSLISFQLFQVLSHKHFNSRKRVLIF